MPEGPLPSLRRPAPEFPPERFEGPGGGGNEVELIRLYRWVEPRPYHPVPRGDMEALVVWFGRRGAGLPLESQAPGWKLRGISPGELLGLFPLGNVPL